MDSRRTLDLARRPRLALAILLSLAALIRLYQFQAPMADNLQAKQVYVANKARAIARTPWNPLRNTLDFLDEQGHRLTLTEEIPLYTGLLGLAYRLFGEHDTLGRILSLLGTLVALAAFFDLVRREHDNQTALVATFLFNLSPLLIFYGRAILPDPWMLACMLLSAACYRRDLDGQGPGWLVATALAGLSAATFKYFGLMVLLPLAEMTRRQGGWRACLNGRFVGLSAAMLGPIALWMLFVFIQTPNPVRSGWAAGQPVYPYLIVQDPGVLATRAFYASWFSRFLLRDCGPVTAVLIVLGVAAVLSRRLRPGPMLGVWTVMGMAFYVLLGPKLIDHDYYELMMLPAASLWGALGWSALRLRTKRTQRASERTIANGPRRLAWWPTSLLVAALFVQSPWVMGSMFQLDQGKVDLAERLKRVCPPEGRVVTMGPGIALVVVLHYSEREGWAIRGREHAEDWPALLDRCRAQGAQYLALYFDPKTNPTERRAYDPLIDSLPVVEHRLGPSLPKGKRSESIILSLRDADLTRLADAVRPDRPTR